MHLSTRIWTTPRTKGHPTLESAAEVPNIGTSADDGRDPIYLADGSPVPEDSHR